MSNIFELQPEFIVENEEYIKNNNISYSSKSLYKRYSAWISENDIKNKTFLDLGSALASAGAYVLSNGAKEYTGVEIDKNFADRSKNNLEKYYDKNLWNIVHSSLEKFLENNDKKYDVVFLGRVLHGSSEKSIYILKQLSLIANTIVIESGTPLNGAVFNLKKMLAENNIDLDKNVLEKIDNYIEYEQPYIEYVDHSGSNYLVTVYSLGFLKLFFNRLGFERDLSSYEELKETFSEEYGMGYIGKHFNPVKKFIVKFHRKHDPACLSWEEFENKNV